jgi:hypothetical protein
LGYLNFCGFHTILPRLQEAIDASPESPTAKKLTELIGPPLKAYADLMEKHGISKESQDQLKKKVTEYSQH